MESAAIIGFFLMLTIVLSVHGESQRVLATRPCAVSLDRPGDAYLAWKDRRLHGRTLYLFDRHINADILPPSINVVPNDENYITAAIKAGIVRRIFHVIPDISWSEVERNMESFPAARHFDGMHRLTGHEGVPIVIMRLRDIRKITEPILISINGEYWTDSEQNFIISLIETGLLKSDMITLWAALPDSLVALERHFEKK